MGVKRIIGWLLGWLGCLLACGCRVEDKRESLLRPASPKETRMTLLFSGDYMQHLPQVNSAKLSDGDFDYGITLSSLSPFFKNADFAIVNFETTVSDSDYTGYPSFRSPAQSLCYLRDVGVDAVVLANNHCCDGGRRGIFLTLATADSCGLLHTGISANSVTVSPILLQKGPIRVALLNYTYGTNGIPVPLGMRVNQIDTTLIGQDIADAFRQGATDVVVYYHWGDEYRMVPSEYQRRLAAWTHEKGVGLVIGSHPHVVQPIEIAMRDSMINGITVFSLGNLISNQSGIMKQGGVSFGVELVRRDSAETRYENPTYLLHWVDRYSKGAKAEYRVIPAFAKDSLLKDIRDTVAVDSFMREARRVIAPLYNLSEITSYP